MGLNLITALEIFTNPSDLEITVGQEKEGAKFAIGIFRGPGHNFKPMLTSQPFAENQENAIKFIAKILQTVHEVLISRGLNPTDQEIDQSKVLNQDLIARILEELRVCGKASTYKMLTPPS
ncbi:MAG: hypothetical protein HGB03_03085 [Candidatus Yonathbacteria bacterium]|nr:hypothetical protein [Candidatus Yonathbacteria bacterium]NTW47382.1 hypothetical protein [Candidatus Yonathbacteria bacterium]